MNCRLFAIAIGFIATCPLLAQPVELLGDLVDSPQSEDFVNVPQPVGVVNGKAILFYPGLEARLWASDGSAAGTLQIADLAYGYLGDVIRVASSPQRLYLLFSSASLVLRTDGTRSGTFLLRDAAGVPLVPRYGDEPAGVDGALYVGACGRSGTSCGIWFHDGTAATSRLLAPLEPSWGSLDLVGLAGNIYWSSDSRILTTGPAQAGAQTLFDSAGSAVVGLKAVAGRLYFMARSAAADELWSSDGTAGGTTLVATFAPPRPESTGVWFRAAGGRVYFPADDGVHGQELWSTGGRAGDARRETNLADDAPFQWYSARADAEYPVGVVGGRLLYAALEDGVGLQLWSQSGSAAPVPLLAPCGPECSPFHPSSDGMLVANGRAYFIANDGAHGYEVWSSDGTLAGTHLLVDSCPGACGGWQWWEYAQRLMTAGDAVVFWTTFDLWLTDGTPAGTRSLHHVAADLRDLGARPVVPVGDRLLFTGIDPTYGAEPFVANPAAGIAELVVPLVGNATRSSNPQAFTSLGDRVVFTASSNHFSGHDALWASDGTASGTHQLADDLDSCGGISGASCPPVAVGNQAFFLQPDDASFRQLWRTDGTVAGTLQLTHLAEGLPEYFTAVAFSGRLYFTHSVTADGLELWKTDGTPAGTQPGFTVAGTDRVSALTALGSELYFAGYRNFGSGTLWRSDGTTAGTRQLLAIDGFPPRFARAGGTVWVLTGGGVDSLWKTDSTADGTHLVAHPNFATDLLSFNGVRYFLCQASPTERALWRVNAQEDGITLLKGFPVNQSGGVRASGMTVFAGNLYFTANSAAEGWELWRSDGTEAGTRLVRDLVPGPESSWIVSLTPTAQGLYFVATDGAHGFELWRSDGSAAGTRMVEDLWPGPTGSAPTLGALAGSRLVFGAADEIVGSEPRSLDIAAPPACLSSDAALCLDGARYRVTASWKDFQGNRGVGHAVGLTADTGYFWFFGPENVEVMIKVLDGRGVNGHDWVFYGALSSVEYTLTVTDTQTGAVRRYFNPTGRLASVGDTQGFGPLGANARTPPAAAPPPAARRIAGGDTSPCVASSTRLCLNGGRFEAQASWKDFSGHTGVGHAVPLTGDTGYLWFFSDTNVEVVLKVLDGLPVNGKFWLFYGALSSVEYSLTVRDTSTGAVRVYRNPSGHMASVADTAAF